MCVEIKNDLALLVSTQNQLYKAQRPFEKLEVAHVISTALPYQDFKAISLTLVVYTRTLTTTTKNTTTGVINIIKIIHYESLQGLEIQKYSFLSEVYFKIKFKVLQKE